MIGCAMPSTKSPYSRG
ncbi:hypothetical protein Taro_004510 [Colocasia esculenta]|uniref:Uncharacterized protein n=1 Tax=Colocasia esculenta TaxID=4460 RepID=A0A843TQ79_COLES|nr:hypothetical protein [Colocasia esculenta]